MQNDNEWRKVKFIGELSQLLNAFDKRVSFARRWRVKRSLSFHRSLYTGVIVLSSCLKRYIGSRGVFTYHGYSRDRLFSLVFNEISYTFTLDHRSQRSMSTIRDVFVKTNNVVDLSVKSVLSMPLNSRSIPSCVSWISLCISNTRFPKYGRAFRCKNKKINKETKWMCMKMERKW